MEISISTQHLHSIDHDLQEYVRTKTITSVNKYFDSAPGAHVNFRREGQGPLYRFTCEIVVNSGVGGHDTISGSHTTDDPRDSFHAAIDHVEKQLLKLHSKLKEHRA